MKKFLLLLLASVVLACSTPTKVCMVDELDLTVLKFTNEYLTNELEIYKDKLGYDCIRTAITEELVPLGFGAAITITSETWQCSYKDCS